MTRISGVLLLALASIVSAVSQEEPTQPAPAKTEPANDIFSGTVTELTADSLTVVRKVPAKQDVLRKFARDSQTKVEGRLRLKARVSVRYRNSDEGQFLALNIIVR